MTGYSISTVSKALNNKADISAATKNEIIEIARKHNYSPNKLAVSLRLKQTKSLAVILPCLTMSCFGYALHAIQKNARRKGYQTILYQYNLKDESITSILQRIDNGQIDGVIILSSEAIDFNNLNYSLPIESELFYSNDESNCINFKSEQLFEKMMKRIVY